MPDATEGERSTIEESRKRVLRLRFKFGVIVGIGNDSGVGVFVSIMNGLISRRLHDPEIDVTTDDGATVAETAAVVPLGLWVRSFVNSSSGSMITGWTPTTDHPSERGGTATMDEEGGGGGRGNCL